MTEEPQWGGRATVARGSGATLKRLPHSTPRERLHMVVQKGRLFQQEHPEVPVLLDKGRYLVVDLDPRKAKKWGQGHRPCFAICPLPETAVAFDAPAPRASRSAALPWVRALVNRITRAPFETELKQLVAFPTRFSTSAHYAAAAKLAQTRLKELGFQTRLQTITVNGSSSFNVIADKAGQGPTPRGVVIVGAHLDSINLSGGPTAPAPGADDDGSGSAGVLSIARAFKDHAAIHDLRLVLFGGEEQGLFGSQQYVASLSSAQRKRIRAVVHMDMIATLNTTQPTVLLEGAALSQSVIDGLADAAATYSALKVQTSLHPFNSDHVSFLDAKIPAVLTIEGTDDANHHIHSANDTLAHVNFDLALAVLRMNLAFVAQAIGKMS
jgi:Zn-dependent M28 family amino/carboxypeptidase